MGLVGTALVATRDLGNNVGTPVADVNWGKFGKPNMSVNAAAFIPPALKAAGVHPHGKDISAPENDGIGHVKIKACIAALVTAEETTVEPKGAGEVNTVKLQPNPPTTVRSRQDELFAVPGHAYGKITMIAVGSRVVTALDHEIVRQVNATPGTVVEVRGRWPLGHTLHVRLQQNPLVKSPWATTAVFDKDCHHVRTTVSPSRVQAHVELLGPALVLAHQLAVQVDPGVVVHAPEI
jgi:hypothetical protein